jgi:uncharacterized protein YgiM (DUF1202 family)
MSGVSSPAGRAGWCRKSEFSPETIMRCASIFAGLVVLLGTSATAAPGDSLVVTGHGVNVRAGPGTDQRVLLQVSSDQAAVEVAREGDWVQVDLPGRDARGWIHGSLLEPAAGAAETPQAQGPGAGGATAGQPPGGAAAPGAIAALPPEEAEALARFENSVRELNARARAVAGVELFPEVDGKGGGMVQVAVTQAWTEIPDAGQESYLNALFDRWLLARGGGQRLGLQIVDPAGEVIMEKTGP